MPIGIFLAWLTGRAVGRGVFGAIAERCETSIENIDNDRVYREEIARLYGQRGSRNVTTDDIREAVRERREREATERKQGSPNADKPPVSPSKPPDSALNAESTFDDSVRNAADQLANLKVTGTVYGSDERCSHCGAKLSSWADGLRNQCGKCGTPIVQDLQTEERQLPGIPSSTTNDNTHPVNSSATTDSVHQTSLSPLVDVDQLNNDMRQYNGRRNRDR